MSAPPQGGSGGAAVRVAVVTPPPLKPSEPGLSGGAAAAALGALGADAFWLDASIGWHRFALAPARLEAAAVSPSAAESAPRNLPALLRAAASMAASPALLRRRETFARREVYSSAVSDLENALRLAALPHPGFRLGVAMLALVEPPRRLESSATLAWAAEARGPFDDYLLEELIPALELRTVTHVAVSLTFQQQGPAAMRLARLLRERLPSVVRVLGGPLVACWKAAGIDLAREPFSLFHRVVAGTPDDLVELAGGARADALGPGGVTPAPAALSVPLDQAPWDDYLAPIPVVPAALARGCYWRRCTFCPDHLHPAPGGSAGDGLAAWLRSVAERFPRGAMLHLTDSALAPAHLERVASVIARDCLPLSWHGFVRAERELADPAFAAHLAEGGCSMLQIGVESGSPDVLRRLGKGASPDTARQVLRSSAAAGIRNHVYLLFGVPGETDLDREATLDLVRREPDAIHAINPALLNLPRGSAMHRHAARFGITELRPFGTGTDLSLYDDFRCGAVHPRREARLWLARRFFKDPAVRAIQGRLRGAFKANHLCFLEA